MNYFQHRNFKPMLLSLKSEPFNSKDYIFEPKFDGMRAIIFVSPKTIRIQSRNQKNITHHFPELYELKKIVQQPTVFDGEIVCFSNGKPSFSLLQKRLWSSIEVPVIFVCFDLLYVGKDVTNYPLLERKQMLNSFQDTSFFVKTFYVCRYGKKFFKNIVRLGLEGMVAKKKDSYYFVNIRSSEWLKIKNWQESWFAIIGYIEHKNSPFFSICLGELLNQKMHMIGQVKVSKQNKLYDALKKINVVNSYDLDLKNNYVQEVFLVYQALVTFLHREKSGKLRQPVFREFKKL